MRIFYILFLSACFSSAYAGIEFRNEYVSNAIGKEWIGDDFPGAPADSKIVLNTFQCIGKACELSLSTVIFSVPTKKHIRIRAVVLKEKTEKTFECRSSYEPRIVRHCPLFQIIDGFAYRDRQNHPRPISRAHPYLDVNDCTSKTDSTARVFAIGMFSQNKKNKQLEEMKPILAAWRVDVQQKKLVSIPPSEVECFSDYSGV